MPADTSPSNVVSGKILVRELNRGIPDLIIAAYDVDFGAQEQSRTEVLRRLAQFVGAGNGGAAVEDILQWWDSMRWDRLGSVLTDRNGQFKLEFGDELFKRRDADEVRPDYILFVLAPEDPMRDSALGPYAAHPLTRLLHFSWVIRSGSGREEAYVIRVARAELDRREIPYADGSEPGHQVAIAAAGKRLAAARAARSSFATVTQPARDELSSAAVAANELMTSFHAHEPDATGRVFVAHPSLRAALQRNLASEGLLRLTGPLRLTLPEMSEGDAVDGAAANETLAGRGETLELSRTRTLLETCVARRERDRMLATATPAEPGDGDTGGGASSETREDPGTLSEAEAAALLRSRALGQIADLPTARSRAMLARLQDSQRATTTTLSRRLDEMELRGGPADAVAYHDFHSLQIAFRSVWRRVFDQGVRGRGEELYERWVAVRRFAGLGEPDAATRAELDDMRSFLTRVERDLSLAAGIAQRTGTLADWDGAAQPLDSFFSMFMPGMPPLPGASAGGLPSPPTPRDMVSWLVGGNGGRRPPGAETGDARGGLVSSGVEPHSHLLGRVEGLTLDLARRLSEDYQFDVFEPGSYNFGIMTTYRQRWEPIAYQAGELVASIPLAPGEKRKLTTRQVIKQRREEVRSEADSRDSKTESATTARADVEIVNRASTTTNFSQTVGGEFGLGEMLKMTTTSQFSNNQQRHSEKKKRDFRESVRKAADAYKRERKLEIKQAEEFESTAEETQEISNPNTEITVTYLFYELQRRYKVSEQLHRARPVILVAQDVPAPDRIDEGFLVAHEWILRRALLDESLRPALESLTSEMPGDEFGVAVLRSTWERNLRVVNLISMQLDARSGLRDSVRTRVLELLQGVVPDDTGRDVAAAIFTGGLSLLFGGGGGGGEDLQAARDAADRELEYTEAEVAETERRLKQAMSALEESTSSYVAAVRAQLNRRTAVDQLRVHVKRNILHYMQAIWRHEPPDQRYFRLYDKPIDWFQVEAGDDSRTVVRTDAPAPGVGDTRSVVSLLFGLGSSRTFAQFAGALIRLREDARRLGEVADLDALIGFKGNYMVFPLVESNALTEYMLQDYVGDDVLGLLDPDDYSNFTNEELAAAIVCARDNGTLTGPALAEAEQLLLDRLVQARRDTEEIIVPTGQLFIEALPGEHPVLEDYKLIHRQLDAEKADAEARAAYLEAIRAASLLSTGDFDDPNVDRLIQVEGSPTVEIDTE